MFIKIANDFEVPISDLVCIINIENNDDKINDEFIIKNNDIVKFFDKKSRSIIVLNDDDKNFIYLSNYSTASIYKSACRNLKNLGALPQTPQTF